ERRRPASDVRHEWSEVRKEPRYRTLGPRVVLSTKNNVGDLEADFFKEADHLRGGVFADVSHVAAVLQFLIFGVYIAAAGIRSVPNKKVEHAFQRSKIRAR